MAHAAFGDVGVSFFVAGAILGDVAVSFCVAGAIFGDVGVSLFVAGAAFGEILVNSRSATCCIDMLVFFNTKCIAGGKSNLGERAGSVLQFHARIMFGSCSNRPPCYMTFQPFSANFS